MTPADLRELPKRVLIGLIQLYRTWISPVRPPTCRFVPTCSEYAVEALTTHGVLRGGYLATVRLLKCGPWHPGGWDPVPERSRGPDLVRDDAPAAAPEAQCAGHVTAAARDAQRAGRTKQTS